MSLYARERMTFARKFGQRMVARRRAARMSQSMLGHRVGISRPTISRWEMGYAVPDVFVWSEIEAVLREREGRGGEKT